MHMAEAQEQAVQSLRQALEQRRTVHDLSVAIPGAASRYRIAAPADADSVLDELAAQVTGADPQAPEPHMPYWATPWASGLALAESVLARSSEVAGVHTLELGCGLGISATAALEAGARLAVTDCIPETLDYCRLNCLVNTGRAPQALLADWRLPAGRETLVASGPYGLVLAADVLYEAEDMEPLLALIPALLESNGQFWLAEPGRATSGKFVAEATAQGWRAEAQTLERDWPAGAGHARVTIHRYAAAKSPLCE